MINNLILKFKTGDTFKCNSEISISNFYGEIVFTTANTGYTECLTDPSYSNQILVFSNPNIGSYGFNKHQFESTRIWPAGIIISELNNNYSSYKANGQLKDILKKYKVTTLITKDIRGIINAIHKNASNKIQLYCNKNLKLKPVKYIKQLYINKLKHAKITTHTIKTCFKVLIIDLGNKHSTAAELNKRNILTITTNTHTLKHTLKQIQPHGIIISSGPGNVNAFKHQIKPIYKTLLKVKTLPILGICLGHQIISLCKKLKIQRMQNGHHGINHPIKFINCKKIFISTQNHNYHVINKHIKHTFFSLFDNSNQGFIWKKQLIISIQGHPEAGPGTSDLKFIFDKYKKTIKKCQKIY